MNSVAIGIGDINYDEIELIGGENTFQLTNYAELASWINYL